MGIRMIRDGAQGTLVQPTAVVGYDSSRTALNTVHQLIDGPVVAVTWAASNGRSGTLKLYFTSKAAAAAADGLHAGAGTWSYEDDDNPAENMHYVVNGQLRKYQTESRRGWMIEIPFAEVNT